MEENKILSLVYTFFLGLLIAIFIGVGINTFYPPPEAPELPNVLNNAWVKEPSNVQIIAQNNYDRQMKEFDESQMNPYNRNVSIITLGAAVVLLAISLLLENRKVRVIAGGVMLGGLFTLIYSIGRGFASQDSKYSFIAVTIGLIIVLYLGYHRFIQDKSKHSKANVKV